MVSRPLQFVMFVTLCDNCLVNYKYFQGYCFNLQLNTNLSFLEAWNYLHVAYGENFQNA